MDAKEYIESIVKPTIAEFHSDPTSTRRAFLACVTTYHIIDYMNAIDKRQSFRNESEAFKKVDLIAHALKHTDTNKGASNNLQIARLKIDDVIPRPPAILGQMELGLSVLGDEIGGVTLTIDISCDALAIVIEALKFLENKIYANNF